MVSEQRFIDGGVPLKQLALRKPNLLRLSTYGGINCSATQDNDFFMFCNHSGAVATPHSAPRCSLRLPTLWTLRVWGEGMF